jgi:hypothetical protein
MPISSTPSTPNPGTSSQVGSPDRASESYFSSGDSDEELESFSTSKNSRQTVNIQRGLGEKQDRKFFVCSVAGCNEQFGRNHDRLRHESRIHKVECDWMCGECSRVFSRKRTLEKHCSSTGHSI